MSVLFKKRNVNIEKIEKKQFNNYNSYFKYIPDGELLYNSMSKIYQLYKDQQKILWTEDEIAIDKPDIDNFQKLDEDKKDIINGIILFFLIADKIVISNLNKIANECSYLDLKAYYSLQDYIENIHDKFYTKTALAYFGEEKLKNELNLLFSVIETAKYYNDEIFDIDNYVSEYYEQKTPTQKKVFKAICHKINLMNKFNFNDSIEHTIVSLFTAEVINFQPLFLILNMLKFNNKGLRLITEGNEFILRDESNHAITGMTIYNDYLVKKVPTDEIREIIKEMALTEIKFIETLIPDNYNIGITTKKNYIDFIKHITNKILININCEIIFKDFDEKCLPDIFNISSLDIKEAFFERQAIYENNLQPIKSFNLSDLRNKLKAIDFN